LLHSDDFRGKCQERRRRAAYPGSANACDSLGEAYMKSGRNDLAIESFKKSLLLDPGNGNARKMLEKLEGK